MKRLVIVMCLVGCMGLVGCRTHERVVEVVRTDTLIQTKVQRDSVYIENSKHDSVYIHQKGDTLLIEKWHTEWRDRWSDRETHDTLYVAKHDTIQQTLTKIDVKEKPMSWWQRVRLKVGDLALWLLAIFLLFLVVKYVVLKAVRP